jgi:hypothetical protein
MQLRATQTAPQSRIPSLQNRICRVVVPRPRVRVPSLTPRKVPGIGRFRRYPDRAVLGDATGARASGNAVEEGGDEPPIRFRASAIVLSWRRAALVVDDFRQSHGWDSRRDAIGAIPIDPAARRGYQRAQRAISDDAEARERRKSGAQRERQKPIRGGAAPAPGGGEIGPRRARRVMWSVPRTLRQRSLRNCLCRSNAARRKRWAVPIVSTGSRMGRGLEGQPVRRFQAKSRDC